MYEQMAADPIGTIKELNTPPAPKDCSGLKTEKGRAYCEAAGGEPSGV